MSEDYGSNSVTFVIAKWYAYVLSATFLLYGGVKIVLSFLDRTYADIGASFIFLVIGVVVVSVALAFRDLKSWGWYGLLVVNGLGLVGSLFHLRDAASNSWDAPSIILLLLSAAAILLLLAPGTKALVSHSR